MPCMLKSPEVKSQNCFNTVSSLPYTKLANKCLKERAKYIQPKQSILPLMEIAPRISLGICSDAYPTVLNRLALDRFLK